MRWYYKKRLCIINYKLDGMIFELSLSKLLFSVSHIKVKMKREPNKQSHQM